MMTADSKPLSNQMKIALKNVADFGPYKIHKEEFRTYWKPVSRVAPHVRNDTLLALERRKAVKIERGLSVITDFGKTILPKLK